MPVGTIILIVAGILIFFGFAHRVLDRMRLTDRQALLIIILAIIGSFIDITLWRGSAELVVNVGGSVVPVALAVWLIATADTGLERWRAVFGAVAAGALLYGLMRILPREAPALPVDPTYLYAVVAGLLAYVLGRSRRGAFTAAILGVTLADIASWAELLVTRTPGRAWLGGAGMLDATVIAGLIAVLVAELVGETAELASGGPRANRRRARGDGGPDRPAPDMSERGSDAARPRERGARERRSGSRPSPDRHASAFAPVSGRDGRDKAGLRADPAHVASRLEKARATRGGPGSGDLDRVELEEPHRYEASRASSTDEVLSRRKQEGEGEEDEPKEQ
ncbi:MAG: DUF1614 domain-containing protein [Bacillota bacterium]|nr:DUF1614 domain-containing protein [Bacillota bacterium]